MGQVYKLVFVIIFILSTNFLAWVLVHVFYKRNVPLRAMVWNSIIGICAAGVGFWSIDIFKWLFY
jgi:hypothetical protein